MAADTGQVAVVGSVNRDVTARVERLPDRGETVLASGHFTGDGGKGANQAVTAARLGRDVAFVGRVGDDPAGQALRDGLADARVDTTQLATDATAPSGLALITVDAAGHNTIVVSPGANGAVTAAQVDAAGDLLATAAVTLLQLEIPVEAVARAAEAAGGTVLLNPAPARPLPAALLERVDVLVPNRAELALLAGAAPADDLDAVAAQARDLTGPAAVVVTLGGQGALVCPAGTDAATHVPAPTVAVADTTGAGDVFCGALADALARGVDLERGARWAVAAAALSTTRPGARGHLPTAADVLSLADGAAS